MRHFILAAPLALMAAACSGKATPAPDAANGAAVSGDAPAYPTDGWPATMDPAKLPAATLAALRKAQTGGGDAGDCPPGEVSQIIDLNGDGRPEVILHNNMLPCGGPPAGGFTVMMAVPGGWKTILDGMGEPDILKTSSKGWPDIRETGTSEFACQALDQWTGAAYENTGYSDGTNSCTPN